MSGLERPTGVRTKGLGWTEPQPPASPCSATLSVQLVKLSEKCWLSDTISRKMHILPPPDSKVRKKAIRRSVVHAGAVAVADSG